jgi:hypothetical protein
MHCGPALLLPLLRAATHCVIGGGRTTALIRKANVKSYGVPKAAARSLVIGAVLLAAVACGYDTSAAFNADGSVNVGLKFLFPTSLMQGSTSGSVQGFSPADISKSNAALAAKYPGAKISLVTEGDESGAAVMIPFKTEKDAFAFLTTPSQLNSAAATSGSSSIDLSNTGGLFATATHTTNGQNDTYTFKSQPPPVASPAAGSSSPISADQFASIFSVTFSLAVPHEIMSAQGALFTLDRKTAIWKMSLTKAQTFTATTGPSVALAALSANGTPGQNSILVIGVALVAIALGFGLGIFQPWLHFGRPGVPTAGPGFAPPGFTPHSAQLAMEPVAVPAPGAWPGPPQGMPPPPSPPHS